MLVDCPGYGDSPGYESSKQDRIEWHELTKVQSGFEAEKNLEL